MPIRPMRILIPVLLLACVAAVAAMGSPDPGALQLPDVTPTGILTDRVVPMARLDELDGSPAAPAVSAARWRQTLFELRRAAEDPAVWPDVAEVRAKAAPGGIPRGTASFGLIHADYDRILADGSLASGEVLAFAPLRQDVYDGADLAFRLEDAFTLDRGAAAIIRLRLDAGDGLGLRDLPLGKELRVSFATEGRKTLRLEVDLSDGRTLHAAAVLDVRALVTPDPTETWQILAAESYGGAFGSGQAYVYLADGHAAVTNPVVVVEGFDLDNTMNWPVLYELLNQENLLEDMRTAGYDAIVLDFTEATDPIQRNALVLTELLAQIRAAVGPATTMPLIGASMGGLVSRYALLWLEDQGVDHQVRTYVSFDSPHLGANIPLGLQYWLYFFRNESTDARLLLDSLDRPAARQMLLYHHLGTTGTTAGSDPLFAEFYGDLATLGGWPQQAYKIAVSNGSGIMTNQGFNPGDQIIEYRHRSFLVDIDGNVWAVPDGGSAVIFDGMLNKIWPLPDSYLTVTVAGTLPWDGAPGGYRGSMAEMDATPAPYGDIIALHDNHCFIPTVSSLALEGAGPFFDVAGAPDLLSMTGFDEVHFPQANQEHIFVSPENKVWFMDAVGMGVSGVAERGSVPAAARLLPAYPNPFNPRTALSFEVSGPQAVDLAIFDARGRRVRTLLEGSAVAAGTMTLTWDGRDDAGRNVPGGVYFARLEAGEVVSNAALTLLK